MKHIAKTHKNHSMQNIKNIEHALHAPQHFKLLPNGIFMQPHIPSRRNNQPRALQKNNNLLKHKNVQHRGKNKI
jgi:hypothetical protein